MIGPVRLEFRAMGNQCEGPFSSDAFQQPLNQRLRRLVAPVRVLQQKQHGAVLGRHQQMFENCEGFVPALIWGHLERGQRFLRGHLEQFCQ